MHTQVYLVLEDGTTFRGTSFGAAAPRVDEIADYSLQEIQTARGMGEVVFNTGMTGYHEILTDPSYSGQLVIMTYPHIGNYGDDPRWSESDSPGVGAAGFIVRSVYRGAVPKGRQSLHSFMKEKGIPGISDIDTRALTLKIRSGGNPKGLIVRPSSGPPSEEASEEASDVPSNAPSEGLGPVEVEKCISLLSSYPDMEGRDIVSQVQALRQAPPDQPVQQAPKSPQNSTKSPQGGAPHVSLQLSLQLSLHVALIDFGYKANIVGELEKRGCRVSIFPADTDKKAIDAAGVGAVLLSNGPGDPAVLSQAIQLARRLSEEYPLFGICLGHQIIGLAWGAKTFKMKFGHHGLNHPVREEKSGRVYITSQNHGFSVKDENLPEELEVWMKNANDHTIEAFRHRSRPIASVQFHPEAAPGPYDTLWVFDEFLSIAKGRS